jgi:uncharacterized Fe-S cluster protein YjdI
MVINHNVKFYTGPQIFLKEDIQICLHNSDFNRGNGFMLTMEEVRNYMTRGL